MAKAESSTASRTTARRTRDLYIVHFSGANATFRIPDWDATCAALGIDYALVPTPHARRVQRLDRKGKRIDRADQLVNGEGDAGHRAGGDDDDIYDAYLVEHTPAHWHPPEAEWTPQTDGRTISSIHLVWLPSDDAARAICARSTQVKAIYSYWAAGLSYDEVHTLLRTHPHALAKVKSFDAEADTARGKDTSSWRAHFTSVHQRLPYATQLARINDFAYLDFRGPIDLKHPEREWAIIEEYSFVANQEEAHRLEREQKGRPAERKTSVSAKEQDASPSSSGKDDHAQRLSKRAPVQVFVGRHVATGTARDLIITMDLKKRVYIGNTSMPAEQSLLMANMALAKTGKIIYDPFAGTGSILYACAQYGAFVLGSDIDSRMMKGKDVAEKGNTGLARAASQYGVQHLVLDALGMDMTQHPWRRPGIFDAVVADPPYGIRAGAKRLGKRNLARLRDEPFEMPDGRMAHEMPDYIAPTRPYHLLDLTRDLLDFAHYVLVVGGRLVFWLPCVNEDDGSLVETPTRTGMRLVARSTQEFGRWSRMLITMEKVSAEGLVADGRIGRIATFGKPVVDTLPSSQLGPAERQAEPLADADGVSSTPSGQAASVGRYRADADVTEFRNRVYAPRVAHQAPPPPRTPPAEPSS